MALTEVVSALESYLSTLWSYLNLLYREQAVSTWGWQADRSLVWFLQLARHKRECPQVCQYAPRTLGHRLELLPIGRISSSSGKLNTVIKAFGLVESRHPDNLGQSPFIKVSWLWTLVTATKYLYNTTQITVWLNNWSPRATQDHT